jgi:hypothetical protein
MQELDRRDISFLWFPIDDFSVANDDKTIQFVQELVRQVYAGKILYIHCLSGRGRTGTIAIPLLMALYPHLSEQRARDLVNQYKAYGRTGRTRGGHMPEMPQQLQQIAAHQVEHKRGGYKAKQEIGNVKKVLTSSPDFYEIKKKKMALVKVTDGIYWYVSTHSIHSTSISSLFGLIASQMWFWKWGWGNVFKPQTAFQILPAHPFQILITPLMLRNVSSI